MEEILKTLNAILPIVVGLIIGLIIRLIDNWHTRELFKLQQEDMKPKPTKTQE